jgi:antitoxin component YwqK of YwqJK toxin-antitoxin module
MSYNENPFPQGWDYRQEMGGVAVYKMKYDTIRENVMREGICYYFAKMPAGSKYLYYLAIKGTYVADKKQGIFQTFTTDGTLIVEEEYVAGSLHGRQRIFCKTTKKVTTDRMYENGQVHGLCMKIRNGVHLIGEYEHGIPVGHHVEIDKEQYRYATRTGLLGVAGVPMMRGEYVEGRRHGVWESYYSMEPGTVVATVMYHMGEIKMIK